MLAFSLNDGSSHVLGLHEWLEGVRREREAWRSKEETDPYQGGKMENKITSWPSGSMMGIKPDLHV